MCVCLSPTNKDGVYVSYSFFTVYAAITQENDVISTTPSDVPCLFPTSKDGVYVLYSFFTFHAAKT